jgi:hypothetical protein
MPDIIEKNLTIKNPLDLSAYQELTNILGLKSNEQTYLINLWLVYAKKYTFARIDVSPSKAYSLIGQLG